MRNRQPYLNNRGFTLLETIFSLFLLSIIVLFFPLIVQFFKTDVSTGFEKEAELFFMQIGREIHSADEIKVIDNKLYLHFLYNDTAKYERFQNLLRRQLKDTGHEIVLQNIKTVSFKMNGKIVTIEIEGLNGKTFKRKFAPIGERNEE